MNKLLRRLMPAAAILLAMALMGGCVGVSFVDSAYARGTVRGEGEMVERQIAVDPYTTVEVRGGIKLVYSATPQDYVTLEMQENLFEYLVVENKPDGHLFIDSDKSFSVSWDKTPVLTLYNPDLAGLKVSGAISVAPGSDTIRGDSFYLHASGACDATLAVEVDSLEAIISGAGDAVVSGSARTAILSISGAGSFDALELQTSHATVMVSGSGDATVSCSDSLEVSVSGAASVGYRGQPTISQHISGAGDIYSIP